jgi:hypothetical protein
MMNDDRELWDRVFTMVLERLMQVVPGQSAESTREAISAANEAVAARRIAFPEGGAS